MKSRSALQGNVYGDVIPALCTGRNCNGRCLFCVVNAKADWLKRDVAERVRTNCKDALAGELRDLMSDISADHHTRRAALVKRLLAASSLKLDARKHVAVS